MTKAPRIRLTATEKVILARWTRLNGGPCRLALRARIVLEAAQGKHDLAIARELGVSKKTASLWRRRFAERRLVGIEKDAPRPGRTPSVSAVIKATIIHKTVRERPQQARNWSTRIMAREIGVSRATVQRVWAANGLKPHLDDRFKDLNGSPSENNSDDTELDD